MRTQLNKAIGVVAMCFVLLTAGLGCKGTPSNLAQQTRPLTLEYWTVYDDVDAITQLADAYKASHPYITIKVRQFRADEIYNQFVAALAEDKGPDIISVQDRSLGQYVSKLATMPASVDDVTVQVVKGQFGTDITYNPQTIPLPNTVQLGKEYVQTVANTVVRNGKIYGLPLSFDTLALFYNKDLLDRAGIAQPPKTWEEFVKDVIKLNKFDKNNNNKIIQSGAALGVGTNVPASDDLLYVLFRQSNIPFETSDGRVVFDNDQVRTAAISIVDFVSDFANPTRDRYSWNANLENALDSFTHGTLAFFFGYNYHFPLVQQRAPQLNFDVVTLPQLKPESPINAASFWLQAVPIKSKHAAQAWGFINYIAHTSANKQYLDKTNRPAALRGYLATQLSAAGTTEKGPPAALGVFAGQALTAESWYKGSNYDAAKSALNDLFKEWLQPPETAGDQWQPGVLNRAASRINQTLQ